MFLERLVVGPLQVNCYIVADEKTREALIIDPGAEPERIKKFIAKHSLKCKAIVNTHTHADHIGANAFFDVPIYVHRLEADYLSDPEKNLSVDMGLRIVSPKAARLLDDKDKITVGNITFIVMHTPGHSPGGISLLTDKAVFTGDVLFYQGIGRTDLPGSDESAMVKSLGALFALDEACAVYPGHGRESSIGEEKKSNTFL